MTRISRLISGLAAWSAARAFSPSAASSRMRIGPSEMVRSISDGSRPTSSHQRSRMSFFSLAWGGVTIEMFQASA